jgi:hypothetical protein
VIQGMTIERLQRRCDYLMKKADALQDWIKEHDILRCFEDQEFLHKWRAMNSLYTEASAISTCLSTFQQSCYQPLGPLV